MILLFWILLSVNLIAGFMLGYATGAARQNPKDTKAWALLRKSVYLLEKGKEIIAYQRQQIKEKDEIINELKKKK